MGIVGWIVLILVILAALSRSPRGSMNAPRTR
jgi:hypothetical protein